MSRSYRQPYCSPGSTSSAKEDKRLAARAYRRLVKRWISISSISEDDHLVPQRRDAAHNNVYGWNRDGRQMYISPYVGWGCNRGRLHSDQEWYQRMLRK